jgi:hypothetical protein
MKFENSSKDCRRTTKSDKRQQQKSMYLDKLAHNDGMLQLILREFSTTYKHTAPGHHHGRFQPSLVESTGGTKREQQQQQ